MKVAVIGGGIQGTSVAMELATRGVRVDLIESNPTLMDEASRYNEGKIHLGFVYANDPSYRTARLMFRGAQQFAPLMRRWLGDAFDDVPVSTPFNYAVHMKSLLSADQLFDTYREIARLMPDEAFTSYFGVENPGHVVRLGATEHEYGPAVDTVFSTQEVAVDPRALADMVAKRVLDTEDIHVFTGARVVSIQARRRQIEISTDGGIPQFMGPYDHIVNCAWSGRPALDATAGLVLEGPWTFRMKYFVLATAPLDMPRLPSTTVVLGGFGDIVDYGTGEHYLSWYPSGCLGWSGELSPPRWPTRPSAAEALKVACDTLENLESVAPGIANIKERGKDALEVLGGVIYSLGDTDVDDPKSGFHSRSKVGLRSVGSYHSVDTGKYSTAPLFAMSTADRVTGGS